MRALSLGLTERLRSSFHVHPFIRELLKVRTQPIEHRCLGGAPQILCDGPVLTAAVLGCRLRVNELANLFRGHADADAAS